MIMYDGMDMLGLYIAIEGRQLFLKYLDPGQSIPLRIGYWQMTYKNSSIVLLSQKRTDAVFGKSILRIIATILLIAVTI